VSDARVSDARLRVGAIVLAGGRSSRFGRDKLAEPIDGTPMLERAISAVRQVATDVVVVAAPDGCPMVPPGTTVARDSRAFEGPLAGLATGLQALDANVEHVIVVGGDMPTLVPAVLERLLALVDRAPAVILEDDAGPRPLPMAARRSIVEPVAERLLAAGERRLRALLAELDNVVAIAPATWRVDDPTGETLRDVDVPGDLPGRR
jgi:molybdopterin-guanine dinucleotide biosynthesis protein A